MKILSKRNLLQVDGNYFAVYNLQNIAALPTHQRLLPLDKHACVSLGHVFIFSQTAFWRTKQKTEQICVSALAWEWHHTAAFPYHPDGVGPCWSSSTNWCHTSLLCLETNCSPSQQTKPAESTDTVLPKSEEIKWQQNWTSFFTYKTSTKKSHWKATEIWYPHIWFVFSSLLINFLVLVKNSFHDKSLVENLETFTHLAHLDESPKHKNFCFHAVPSKRNQSKDLTAILCLKYWLQSNGDSTVWVGLTLQLS